MIVLNIVAQKTGCEINFINKLKKLTKQSIEDIFISLKEQKDQAIANIINKEIILDVFLVSDKEIQKYNKKFRNIDSATNVITLQYFSKKELEITKEEKLYLGNIFISMDTLKNESATFKIEITNHYLRLLIHGALHMMGYDHNNDKEATEMYSMEEYILSRLQIKSKGLVHNYWH